MSIATPICQTKAKRSALNIALTAVIGVVGVTILNNVAHASQIEQVTIYQGLASVTRSQSVSEGQAINPATGERLVVFSCLSPNLDNDSLSIQADTGINLGEIAIETVSGERAKACALQADASGGSQVERDTLARLSAELEAVRLAGAYLQNLTDAEQVDTANIAQNTKAIESEGQRLALRRTQLENEVALAKERLRQTSGGIVVDPETDSDKTYTQVSVRTASRGSGMVTLNYQVRGASWAPTYQARLDTQTETMTLTASALIAQQTGEQWQDIPLTLSTVNPNRNVTARTPYPERLSLYDPKQRQGKYMASEAIDAMPVMVVDDASAEMAMGNASAPLPPLPSFDVSSSSVSGITEYRLPQRITLPSDGRQVQTVIDRKSGQSDTWLRTTPERSLQAYWYASAPFVPSNWVDGSLQLYRDGNYVGQSRLNYANLREAGIGFGVDPQILLKQITDESNQGNEGVFNRTEQQTRLEAYRITNLHDRTVSLEVLGSEPIAQDDDIKLTVTHTPPVSKQNWNDTDGVVAWRFDLAPQQSQTVQTAVTIAYPADKELR